MKLFRNKVPSPSDKRDQFENISRKEENSDTWCKHAYRAALGHHMGVASYFTLLISSWLGWGSFLGKGGGDMASKDTGAEKDQSQVAS